jgi:hypothetical protein
MRLPIWWRRDSPQPTAHRRHPCHRIAVLAAVAITVLAALLRLEVISARYGPLDHPRWVHWLDRQVVPQARRLRPESIVWQRDPLPYVGGDPIGYLRFAREMDHFYQPHVREPMFLATTRAFLWLLDDRDVAVSFASASASSLLVFATFLLGAAAFSRLVGLAAALALAIEYDAITWGVDGWRDDTFALFVALTAWRFVRLQQAPGRANAVWAGVAAAGACLTRITALSFVLPALVWVVATAPRDARRAMARATGLAAAVLAVLFAPYLISCAVATGDPLLAINHHTRYYLDAEGRPIDKSTGAFEYVTEKLVVRPVAAFDTAITGLFVWPFTMKWGGFAAWSPRLAHALQWSAGTGLLLFLFSPTGRLLLVLVAASMIPYALTWPIGGGGAFRFSLHAYPFYLIAAAFAVTQAARLTAKLVSIARAPRRLAGTVDRPRAARVALVAALAAFAWGTYLVLPYFVAREALASGDAATIGAGPRDAPYFVEGWSDAYGGGNVTVRAAISERTRMRVPLPLDADHWLTLRIDPAETREEALQPTVTVFLNRRPIAGLNLGRNPERMGSYRMVVPRELAGRSVARLEFAASHTVPASEAGRHFASLPPQTPVAFRLWYVRLEPK